MTSRGQLSPACLWIFLALGGLNALTAQPLAITGRVVDQDERAAKAQVELLPVLSHYEAARQRFDGRRPAPAAQAETDADGRFRLSAPSAGFWQLRVSAPGKLTMTRAFAGEPLLSPSTVPLLKLEAATEMRLVVQDAAGQPVAGAVVHASEQKPPRRQTRADWSPEPVRTTTGANGRARIQRAAGARLEVGAWRPGHGVAIKVFDGEARGTLELSAGRPRGLRFTDAGGNPAPGVLIRTEGWAVAMSDEAGEASVQPKDAGWAFEAIAPDGRRFALRLENDEGVDAPFEVALPEPQFGYGVVVAAADRRPLSGALVMPSRDVGRLVRTDAQGGFAVLTSDADRSIVAVAAGYLLGYERLSDAKSSYTLALQPALDLDGVVVDATGDPIEGARIVADLNHDGHSGPLARAPSRSASSDRQGRFLLSRLGEARYRVSAGKAGFAPTEIKVSSPSAAALEGGLRLELEHGKGAVGRVVDADRVGVVGAEVLLSRDQNGTNSVRYRYPPEPGAVPSEATTAAGGEFSLTGLATGRYLMTVTAPGFARHQDIGIEISVAEPVADLGTVTLEPGVTLRGQVVDTDNAPVEGAELTFSESGQRTMAWSEDSQQSVESAADGTFAIPDRRLGEELSIHASRSGYVRRDVPGVRVDPAVSLDIVLIAGVTVRGQVLDPDGQPVPRARVEVAKEGAASSYGQNVRRRWQRTVADDLGRFAIEDIEPGPVRLAAEAREWLRVEVGGIELEAGSDLEDVELTLRAGGRIEGRVIGADGQPVQDAYVSTESSGGGRQSSAQTDGDGGYVLAAVEPGRHLVTATAFEAGMSASEEIEVGAGVEQLDFYLTTGVEVSGRVLTSDGQPVEDALIQLQPTGSWHIIPSTHSNADGSFAIDSVPSGVYRMSLDHETYAAAAPQPPLEIATQPVLGLDLRMTEGGRVVGSLIGLDPSSLVNVNVMAMRPPSGYQEGVVDSSGSFRISQLSPGEWLVMARTADGRSAQATAEVVEGGGEAQLDLEFEDGLTLTGQVLRAGEPQSQLWVSAASDETASTGWDSTNYEGRFEIKGLEPGTYTLRLRSHATGLSHTETVEVRRDDDILIELEGASVSGVVRDAETNDPIAGVVVRLEPQNSGEGPHRAQGASSDQLGRFTLTDVAQGEYRLTVEQPGYAAYSAPLDLDAGESLDDIDITLERVEGLAFRITSHLGTPVGAVHWALLDATESLQASGNEMATSAGLVRLTTAPEGDWTVLLSTPGSALHRLQVSAPAGERAIQLEAAARLSLVVDELKETTTTAKLTIRGPDGRPFRGLTWGGRLHDEWTVFLGRATVEDLPPGRWLLTVTALDEGSWEREVTLKAGANEVVFD